MKRQRLEYIDLIKGIAIFLVVLGHATIPRSSYIYSFHVPLFFFISGYLYNDRPVIGNFIVKLKSIYFPFVFFNVLTWIFFYSLDKFRGSPIESGRYVLLYKTIVGFGNSVPQNGPLWFLLCLFTVSVIYNLILRIKSGWLIHTFIAVITILGFLISQKLSDLPFKIETAMVMILFFHAGKLYRQNNFSDIIKKIPLYLIIILSIILITTHFISNNFNIGSSDIERVSVLENRYGNFLLFFISSLCAINYFSIISVKVNSVNFINFLGKNSLIILCIHYPILQYVERIHRAFYSGSVFFDFISSIITIILCLPFILIFKAFLNTFFNRIKNKTEVQDGTHG